MLTARDFIAVRCERLADHELLKELAETRPETREAKQLAGEQVLRTANVRPLVEIVRRTLG